MTRNLMNEILQKKNGIKRPGLQVTLSRIKNRHDLKSIEQAACFYIKKYKLLINVSSLIDDVTRKAVQDNLDSSDRIIPSEVPARRAKSVRKLNKSIDPFIPNGVITAASNNAEIYPTVYLFENSVREFVVAVMKKEFKENWWDDKVAKSNPKLQENVEIRRLAEKDSPWHSRRGAAAVFYTDINDLKKIINTYGKEFRKILNNKFDLVVVWISEIEKTRNILAHHNPVTKRDRERLELFAHDWSECAKSVFDKI